MFNFIAAYLLILIIAYLALSAEAFFYGMLDKSVWYLLAINVVIAVAALGAV